MFAKFDLPTYDGHRHPSADAFACLADRLDGADAVRRIEIPDTPRVYLVAIVRRDRPPVHLAWLRGAGPGDPPRSVAWNGVTFQATAHPSQFDPRPTSGADRTPPTSYDKPPVRNQP